MHGMMHMCVVVFLVAVPRSCRFPAAAPIVTLLDPPPRLPRPQSCPLPALLPSFLATAACRRTVVARIRSTAAAAAVALAACSPVSVATIRRIVRAYIHQITSSRCPRRSPCARRRYRRLYPGGTDVLFTKRR